MSSDNNNCKNCSFPFQGHEKFCPDCGQKYLGETLSFKLFMSEIFKGITSWDSKFWKTIYLLLIKPGEIAKEYILGKRTKFTNPFRLYIITSFLCFAIWNLSSNISTFGNIYGNEVSAEVSASVENKEEPENLVLSLRGRGIKYTDYLDLKEKYSNISINQCLDSLNLERNFSNRVILKVYSVKHTYKGSNKVLVNQVLEKMIGYISPVSILVLPLFTLFLMLFYIRKKHNYTYIDHLIFVFYTQSAFFIYLFLNELISLVGDSIYISVAFSVGFLIYMFLAVKCFYNQGLRKTFLKFILMSSLYIAILVIVSVILILFSVLML